MRSAMSSPQVVNRSIAFCAAATLWSHLSVIAIRPCSAMFCYVLYSFSYVLLWRSPPVGRPWMSTRQNSFSSPTAFPLPARGLQQPRRSPGRGPENRLPRRCEGLFMGDHAQIGKGADRPGHPDRSRPPQGLPRHPGGRGMAGPDPHSGDGFGEPRVRCRDDPLPPASAPASFSAWVVYSLRR